MFKFLALFILISFVACSPESKEDSQASAESTLPDVKPQLPKGLGEIMSAHQTDRYYEHKALSFDIQLVFDAEVRLTGTVNMLTDGTCVRIDKSNGEKLLYNPNGFFANVDEAVSEKARFDVLTWPYFFASPFKLNDPGTRWEAQSALPLMPESEPLNTYLLSFKENTGDSPDDWYLVYENMESHLVEGMAYIVTFNKSKEEAEVEPHAITYHDYQPTDEIPFARTWKFWMWEKETGVGKQLGEAKISNIEFIEPRDSYFDEMKIEHMAQIGEIQ